MVKGYNLLVFVSGLQRVRCADDQKTQVSDVVSRVGDVRQQSALRFGKFPKLRMGKGISMKLHASWNQNHGRIPSELHETMGILDH